MPHLRRKFYNIKMPVENQRDALELRLEQKEEKNSSCAAENSSALVYLLHIHQLLHGACTCEACFSHVPHKG